MDAKTLLKKDEKIMWEGKPDLKSFILGNYWIIWLISYGASLFNFAHGHFRDPFEFSLAILITLIIVPICWYYVPKYQFMITDKRLIIKKSFIYTVTDIIQYDKITDIRMAQGPIDKMLGVGTVGAYVMGVDSTQIMPMNILKDYEHAYKTLQDAWENYRNKNN